MGYFIFSKNHIESPKVAQLARNRPIWSPATLGDAAQIEINLLCNVAQGGQDKYIVCLLSLTFCQNNFARVYEP